MVSRFHHEDVTKQSANVFTKAKQFELLGLDRLPAFGLIPVAHHLIGGRDIVLARTIRVKTDVGT